MWCGAKQGGYNTRTGSRVVLTVAHLGAPVVGLLGPSELPFFFHMTGTAETHEVFQAIRFLVSIQSEHFEGTAVMYHRTIAERFAVLAADGAGFVVAQPGGTTGSTPGRPVVASDTALPVRVRLSHWRQRAEPAQATGVGAEPIALTDLVAAYFVDPPAALAGTFRLAPIVLPGGLRIQRIAAPLGAGSLVVFGLALGQREDLPTRLADGFGRIHTDGTRCTFGFDTRDLHGTWCARWLLAAMATAEFREALGGARFLLVGGVPDREAKFAPADHTMRALGGAPWDAAATGEGLAESAQSQEFTAARIGTGGAVPTADEDASTGAALLRFHTAIIPQYHLGAPTAADRAAGRCWGNKHSKLDVRDCNLAALCNACHLGFDRDDHTRNAAETRRRRRQAAGQAVLGVA